MEERFSVGRVLGNTFSNLFNNVVPLGSFALLFHAITAAAGWFATADAFNMQNLLATDPAALTKMFSSPSYWLASALSLLVYFFVHSGLTYAFLRSAAGKSATFADCVSGGVRYFLPMLGLTILWSLGVSVGWVLFLVPGLILITMWSASTAALVQENIGVIGAFGRSRALTHGHRWRVFGALLVFIFAYFILAGVIGALFGLLIGTGGVGANTIAFFQVVNALVSGVMAIFMCSFLVAIYLELVLIKQGGFTDHLAEVFA